MSARTVVGYYAHHQGRGHLSRAEAIIARLDADVTVLSSAEYDGPARYIPLPLDEGAPEDRPDAGGALHWAPLGSSGLRARMARIVSWIEHARPAAFVVDVSVEVALLARLCGVPTVVVAMPGDRSDGPHQMAYRAADRIVAAWPRELYEPDWLRDHAGRTAYVGGISRFAGRPARQLEAGEAKRVVVLGGQGGTSITRAAVERAAAGTPGWEWTALGVAGAPWVTDPFATLCAADVVVAAAGQSSVADLAVVRRPTVVLCERRPYDEQLATGAALERGGLATVLRQWPAPEQWPGLLEAAIRQATADSSRWDRWRTDGAAERAAAAIREVVR